MGRRPPHAAPALWFCVLGGCAGPTSGLSITTTAANGAWEIPAFEVCMVMPCDLDDPPADIYADAIGRLQLREAAKSLIAA
jgi:hypothetical protein